MSRKIGQFSFQIIKKTFENLTPSAPVIQFVCMSTWTKLNRHCWECAGRYPQAPPNWVLHSYRPAYFVWCLAILSAMMEKASNHSSRFALRFSLGTSGMKRLPVHCDKITIRWFRSDRPLFAIYIVVLHFFRFQIQAAYLLTCAFKATETQLNARLLIASSKYILSVCYID